MSNEHNLETIPKIIELINEILDRDQVLYLAERIFPAGSNPCSNRMPAYICLQELMDYALRNGRMTEIMSYILLVNPTAPQSSELSSLIVGLDSAVPPPTYSGDRLKTLQQHIARDQALLAEYEAELHVEDDPRRIAKIEKEIARQKESIARYEAEASAIMGSQPGSRDFPPIFTAIDDVMMVGGEPESKGVGDFESTLESMPMPGGDEEPELAPLRLDAALPGQVQKDRSFEVAVAVRQPDSPQLKEEDLDTTTSEDFQVEWPEEMDSIKLRIQISAPDCDIHGQDSYAFRLYKGKDSPTFYFQLTPKKTGRIGLVITVYQEVEWLGGARFHTEVQETAAAKLDVNIYTGSMQDGRKGKVAVVKEMEDRFDTPELRVLCYDLDVKYDDLRGEIFAEKVRSLVDHMFRHGRVLDLLQELHSRRDMVDWEGLVGIGTAVPA